MKKIILGLFLTVGVSGFALAGNAINENEIKKTTDTKNIIEVTAIKNYNVDMLSICTITITETNHFGVVINQWQESYYVQDWDFAGCKAIGDLRVAQLNATL